MDRPSRPFILFLFAASQAYAAAVNLLPNASFEDADKGKSSPKGWTLVGDKGAWEKEGRTGERSISVSGTGKSSTYWRCAAPALAPGRAYRLSFHVRSRDGKPGGCVISGPNFANRDYRATTDWQQHTFVFTPASQWKGAYVRFGEWHRNDTVLFDDVSLTEVIPVHNVRGDMVLGAGESVRGKAYAFEPKFGHEAGNYSRCLVEATAGFNSNRWVFGPGAYVAYKHKVGSAVFRSAELTIDIGHYVSGACWVECSRDGKQWLTVGKVQGIASETLALPKEIFPAQEVHMRLRSPGESGAKEDSAPGAFQVYGYKFESELAVEQRDMMGTTKFLDIRTQSKDVRVEVISVGDLLPGEDKALRMSVCNNTDQALALTIGLAAESADQQAKPIAEPKTVTVEPKRERKVSVPYTLRSAGDFQLRLSLSTGDKTLYEVTTPFSVPSLYESSYGYWLGESVDAAWWWCEGTYKVSRERSTPLRETSRPVVVAAARGEYEPVQIVLKPKRKAEGVRLTIQAGDPRWAGRVRLYSVAYHYVHRATDRSGSIGWWPDAIPPYTEPLALAAGRNQPLWVLVRAPDDCPAGDHELRLIVEGKNLERLSVPIKVHVHDFAMPATPHLASGFGLSSGAIRRYHNLATREEERHVWDLYMQSFREHRISPYAFAPFDPIQGQFAGAVWQGGRVVQETPPEGKYCLELEDDNPKANVACTAAYSIPVEPGASYLLSWWARTATPGQPYMVTLTTEDRDGRWISGHNLDIRCQGKDKWEWVEHQVAPTKRSPQAAFVRVHLRATEWKEAGAPLGTTWYDHVAFVKEGTKENLVRSPGFEVDGVKIEAKLDFSAWDVQAKKYLDDYGFTSFRLGLKGMGGGTFHSRRAGQIGPFEQGSPGYRRAFKDYCMQLQRHLEEKGWLEKAYIYWFDEPAPKDYEFVKAGMEEIKLGGPKLQRMLTEEPGEALYGSVDIWCPVLHNHHPEVCQARQKQGERIWWYVCCGPKAPYPGLFIDHNAIDLRIWLWMTWKWDVQGILVWTSNYWTSPCAYPRPKIQNPWQDPMGYVSGYDRPPGYIGYWGNGDGRFLYPPNRDVVNDKDKHLAGPVSSIRWEMLREGLEDYEYFWLLRAAVAKARAAKVESAVLAEAEKLLTIPEAIIVDKTHFTRDPLPLYAHRRALAEAIERVSKLTPK